MFHKEGNTIIAITLAIVLGLVTISSLVVTNSIAQIALYVVALFILVIVLQFFRNPTRKTSIGDDNIVSPVDGKVVVIEEVYEKEYFKEKRLQVSVFMSPINVHVTRNPIKGVVKFSKYHPGEFLVAWHPKCSELNERTTVVIENNRFNVLYRQIAGALARRIVNYAKEGQNVEQGADSGFIKFGSRVDLFLPLDADVQVKIGDKVRGAESIIAKINA